MCNRQSGRTSTRLAKYPKKRIQDLAGAVRFRLKTIAAARIVLTLSGVGRATCPVRSSTDPEIQDAVWAVETTSPN